jgi:cell division protein FtsL
MGFLFMPKKISILLVIIFAIGLFYGLIQQIYNSAGAGNRLSQTQIEVDKLKEENTKLKNELNSLQNLSYIETIARDKLLLSRPNETVVIINPKRIEEYLASQSAQPKEVLPNWRGWLKLFGV